MHAETILIVLGSLAYVVVFAYLGLAGAVVLGRGRTPRSPPSSPPEAVSVLVPLHGTFRGLDECLESLFSQDHPCFEIVFGTRDPDDPAIRAVETAQRRHPSCRSRVVTTPVPSPGLNPKVVNLEAIEPYARHDLLVLVDADIVLPPDHLRRVTAPLADPSVGLVTCPYGARLPSGAGLWARLAALYVGDWFYTSVLVATLVAPDAHGFGATLALRRETLSASGGWAALRTVLADDHVLAARVRGLGLRTGVLETGARTVIAENRFRDLWAHETRWLGTIRALDPWGYLGLPATMSSVVLVVGLVLLGGTAWAWAGFAFLALGRLVLHFLAWNRSRSDRFPDAVLLLPIRDALTFAEWLAALVARRLRWKTSLLTIDDRGQLEDNQP
jgi:ceramide glucosyltransferase